MTEGLKRHMPVIVGVSLVGIVTTALLMNYVIGIAGQFDVDGFLWALFLIPCFAMLICSFIIAATSHEISRTLYFILVGTCLACGIASMIATSVIVSDAALASQLLANSADGTTITPPTNSPLIVLRDIAAYVVAPTVGCIFGAWLGSRFHSMSAA